MSTIDLGDNPVGSTPTDAQKTQLRSSIGLGSSDTVEFGAIVPPAGSTAEINAIADAEVGSVVLDTDRDQYVRFSSPSEYSAVGAVVLNTTYYVDPVNGSDTKGKGGVFPFATINAALKASSAANETVLNIVCLAGTYTEEDALNGVSDTSDVIITFQEGSFWIPSANVSPLFDNSAANLNINGIYGSLIPILIQRPLFKGECKDAGTIIEVNSNSKGSETDPFIEVTSGLCNVNIKQPIRENSQTPFSLVKVSGDAEVTLNNIDINILSPYGSQTVPALVLLSDTAKVNINNAKVKGMGLCEITTDTACKAVISNCISSANGAPPFIGQTSQSIAAPSGSSNPEVFAIGGNLIDVAASNITVNVDGGSLTVSSTSLDILS